MAEDQLNTSSIDNNTDAPIMVHDVDRVEKMRVDIAEIIGQPPDSEKVEEIVRLFESSKVYLDSPLFSPKYLSQYVEIVGKSGSEKLIEMALVEQQHRHKLISEQVLRKTTIISEDIKRVNRSQTMGFAISLTLIFASIYSIIIRDLFAFSLFFMFGICSIILPILFARLTLSEQKESKD